MRKKISIIIIIVFISNILLTNLYPTQALTQKLPVSLHFQGYRQDLGEEVHVEFNRVNLTDNMVFQPGDRINFSFTYDVADTGLNAYEYDSQANYWHFNTPDENGIYNETRFLGKINFFFDSYDLGSYRWNQGSLLTEQYIDLVLEEGWHYLTILAAEYVSDNTHTSFSWKWSKDQIKFYVSVKELNQAPSIKLARNYCNFEANMTNTEDFEYSFPWFYALISPYSEIPQVNISLIRQTMYRKNDNAKAYVNFNVSYSDLFMLNTSGSYCIFRNASTFGKGDYSWFINDGEIVHNLVGSFQLTKGRNFVVFTCIGFGVEIQSAREFHPKPTFSSMVYEIDNTDPFGINYSYLYNILFIIGIAIVFNRKQRRNK